MSIENKNTAPAIASPLDSSVLEAEGKAIKSSTSRGERLFDWLTYGGIAGVGAFALTIPVAYWAKYGKGAKHFHAAAQGLEKAGLSAATAEEVVMTSALMQGGNIALVPIKMMENYKNELVAYFNRILGDKSADASVEEDPKQTWGSLIKSRLVAWVAVFTGFRGAAAILGGDKLEKFNQSFAEHVICRPLGQATHTPGLAKTVANETRLFRYGKIAALDIFATAAASVLLYAGTRIFAKKNEHLHAKHTVSSHLPAAAATPPEASAAVEPGQKRFTSTITPSTGELAVKPRSDSFGETVTTQKSSASETFAGLSA